MSETNVVEMIREGISLAKGNRPDEARAILSQVIQQDPKNEMALLWFAGVAKDPLESLETLQKVLNINPNHEHARSGIKQVRFQAGVAAAKNGKKAQARQLFLDSFQDNPRDENALMWLASVAETPEEAVKYLEKAQEINPKNDRIPTALEHYRKKIQTVRQSWQCPICETNLPSKPITCSSCGSILQLVDVENILRNGSADEEFVREGIKRMLNRVRSKPDFALHCYIGIAYLNIQQIREAIGQFQGALRLQAHEGLAAQIKVLENRLRHQENEARIQEEKKRAETRKVMIVDDSTTIRKLVSITLQRQQFMVIEASDGQEALEIIEQDGPPNLILLDIMMPGMDGYTLCKQLRGKKATANLPIIMLSGKDGLFNKMRGKMAGSTLYLTKPFEPQALLKVVQEYCRIPERELVGV